jgi:hypothetical protein
VARPVNGVAGPRRAWLGGVVAVAGGSAGAVGGCPRDAPGGAALIRWG